VPSAVIVDGRVPHSLLLELFTNAGQGTMIIPDDPASATLESSGEFL
jgi:acetylglutamate kinase